MRQLSINGLLALMLGMQATLAVEIREKRWGFDGQVVPERFNLLSVLVANDSAEPFDGALTLQRNQGLATQIGAVYQQPCYVAPFTERWVQFHPYIGMESSWELRWGRRLDERENVDPPKLGPPARVLLSDPESALDVKNAFRSFPDHLFPTTVAAADGLDSVVLDYAPRWEAVKRRAFVDWARRGGTVHLLQAEDGKYPVFVEEMAVLNSPLERVRLGAGWVVHHAATRRDATESVLAASGFPAPDLRTGQHVVVYQIPEGILRALSGLTRPHHNWGLIYLLTLVYIGVVGPWNYLLGKRRRDYRLAMGAMLVAVAGFSFLFSFVGRRGQGEASSVHTLSYARAVGNSSYEVTQWINVFVTRGSLYTIHHAAPHNLYAIANDYEPVNGVIRSGKDGSFTVDMPLYSQRSFLHQAVMTGEDTSVEVLSWPAEDESHVFKLAVGPNFPHHALSIWVLHRDTVYSMELKNGQLVSATSVSLRQFLSPEKLQQAEMNYGPRYRYRTYNSETGERKEDVEATFSKLIPVVIGWGLGGTEGFQRQVTTHRADDDRMQMFVFARSPESFSAGNKEFGREAGYVLYHYDFFKPPGVKGAS